MRTTLFIMLALTSQQLAAQNCESVIALSKRVSVTVEDQKSLEAAAADFCSSYSKATANSSGSSLGIGFGMLSASFGSANADVSSVASRYCSVQNSSHAREDAYRRYIESISPDAYRAYELCIRYSQQDLKFSLDPATTLPSEFTMVALYASKTQGARAELAFDASDGVACAWVGNSAGKQLLESGSSAALKCKRADSGTKSYVSVFSPTIAIEPLSIPWQAYTKDGTPTDAVDALRQSLDAVESRARAYDNRLAAMEAEIRGAKVAVSMGNCKSPADSWRAANLTPKPGEAPLCAPGHIVAGVNPANNEAACCTYDLSLP